jgi:hypothetical protein
VNQLSFHISEFEGAMWVYLFVDGRPIEELVEGESGGLHSTYFGSDDLPHLPPWSEHWDGETYMVSHCSCGEYGCGNTNCRILVEEDLIVMDRFRTGNATNDSLKFEFHREEFKMVIAALYQAIQKDAQAAPSNGG